MNVLKEHDTMQVNLGKFIFEVFYSPAELNELN